MVRTYLVVLSAEHDRDKITEFLDTNQSISFWFYNLPSTIFIRTPMSAEQLWRLLEGKFGEKRIFITEVSSNRHGRLPSDHWNHFK